MESFSEDTLFAITSYLTSVDILNVALTCRHFGGKPGGVSAGVSSKKRKAKNNTANVESSSGRQWTLMEEMAKRRIDETKKDIDWQEKWEGTDVYKLTRRKGSESWIRVDNCIQKMSSALVFHRLIGSGGAGVGYIRKNPSHIEMKSTREVIPDERFSHPDDFPTMVNSIAVCQDVMTEGRHYAEFTVLQEGWITPGIMQPIRSCYDATFVKRIPLCEAGGWLNILRSYSHVSYSHRWNDVSTSHRFFGEDSDDTPFTIVFQPKGTVIGLLLDLDTDMLQMYVNGEMRYQFEDGYSGGQYSWATLISRTNDDRGAVKVERGTPPPLVVYYETNGEGEVVR